MQTDPPAPDPATVRVEPVSGHARGERGTDAAPGYLFLSPREAAFIRAVVDHMIPADDLTPKGTDIGIDIFIDRALASGWGRGAQLYLQGPWQDGTPNQGYQLPLTPAMLYRASIGAADAACIRACGLPFDQAPAERREALLLGMRRGEITFENGPPARVFFGMLYQNVMEGLFSDPHHGGNRGRIGWTLVGFPGSVEAARRPAAAARGEDRT